MSQNRSKKHSCNFKYRSAVKMSLENRKKFYKIFMEQGMEDKAKDLLKAHPDMLKEIEKPEEETAPKKKKRK